MGADHSQPPGACCGLTLYTIDMFLFSLLVPSGTRDKRHPPKLTWRSQQGDDTGRQTSGGTFGVLWALPTQGLLSSFPSFFLPSTNIILHERVFFTLQVSQFFLFCSPSPRRFWNHCTGTPYNPLKNTPGHKAQTLKIANHLLLHSGSEKRPVLCMYSVQSKSPRGTPYVVPSSGRSLLCTYPPSPVPRTVYNPDTVACRTSLLFYATCAKSIDIDIDTRPSLVLAKYSVLHSWLTGHLSVG